MRIHVKADGRRINLILPTALALNRLTAQIIAGTARTKTEITLNAGQLYRLFKVVKQCKKAHPHWTLVEVRTGDGEEITVKL